MAHNLGGVISSLVFRNEDVLCQSVFIVACLALRRYFAQLNRKIDSGAIPFADGMDKHPEYRYAVWPEVHSFPGGYWRIWNWFPSIVSFGFSKYYHLCYR